MTRRPGPPRSPGNGRRRRHRRRSHVHRSPRQPLAPSRPSRSMPPPPVPSPPSGPPAPVPSYIMDGARPGHHRQCQQAGPRHHTLSYPLNNVDGFGGSGGSDGSDGSDRANQVRYNTQQNNSHNRYCCPYHQAARTQQNQVQGGNNPQGSQAFPVPNTPLTPLQPLSPFIKPEDTGGNDNDLPFLPDFSDPAMSRFAGQAPVVKTEGDDMDALMHMYLDLAKLKAAGLLGCGNSSGHALRSSPIVKTEESDLLPPSQLLFPQPHSYANTPMDQDGAPPRTVTHTAVGQEPQQHDIVLHAAAPPGVTLVNEYAPGHELWGYRDAALQGQRSSLMLSADQQQLLLEDAMSSAAGSTNHPAHTPSAGGGAMGPPTALGAAAGIGPSPHAAGHDMVLAAGSSQGIQDPQGLQLQNAHALQHNTALDTFNFGASRPEQMWLAAQPQLPYAPGPPSSSPNTTTAARTRAAHLHEAARAEHYISPSLLSTPIDGGTGGRNSNTAAGVAPDSTQPSLFAPNRMPQAFYCNPRDLFNQADGHVDGDNDRDPSGDGDGSGCGESQDGNESGSEDSDDSDDEHDNNDMPAVAVAFGAQATAAAPARSIKRSSSPCHWADRQPPPKRQMTHDLNDLNSVNSFDGRQAEDEDNEVDETWFYRIENYVRLTPSRSMSPEPEASPNTANPAATTEMASDPLSLSAAVREDAEPDAASAHNGTVWPGDCFTEQDPGLEDAEEQMEQEPQQPLPDVPPPVQPHPQIQPQPLPQPQYRALGSHASFFGSAAYFDRLRHFGSEPPPSQHDRELLQPLGALVPLRHQPQAQPQAQPEALPQLLPQQQPQPQPRQPAHPQRHHNQCFARRHPLPRQPAPTRRPDTSEPAQSAQPAQPTRPTGPVGPAGLGGSAGGFFWRQRPVDSERRHKDELLLRLKREGYTYREIRDKGKFAEAESTLRGRYRTLTKAKEERVRKPVWTVRDDALLVFAIHRWTTSGGTGATGGSGGRGGSAKGYSNGHIPWKAVADEIVAHGGTYHFGNTTCRKRYDLVLDRCQIKTAGEKGNSQTRSDKRSAMHAALGKLIGDGDSNVYGFFGSQALLDMETSAQQTEKKEGDAETEEGEKEKEKVEEKEEEDNDDDDDDGVKNEEVEEVEEEEEDDDDNDEVKNEEVEDEEEYDIYSAGDSDSESPETE